MKKSRCLGRKGHMNIKGGQVSLSDSNSRVIGLRQLRNNLSEVLESVINGFDVIESGNVKKSKSNKATLISSVILDDILNAYKFTPVMNFDDATQQYEVIFDEVNVYGCGESKEDAVDMVLDLAKDSALEYFNNIDLYVRLPEYKDKYPYYLRILRASSDDELIEVLGL